MIDQPLWDRLREVDTPTVCNAIEVVQGGRGFNAFTRGTVLCSAPQEGAVVGYARTARIVAQQPSAEPVSVIRQRRMDYYRYMSKGPRPALAVVEDADFPDAVGAYWGEINTTVHKGFGLSGALTNGVMRDLDDLREGFPVIAGSVGPSHAFVHVVEIDGPVTVFGLRVCPGDLVHADRHGAVVIPPDVYSSLVEAIHTLQQTEQMVLDPARKSGFNFAEFEKAWSAFEKARV